MGLRIAEVAGVALITIIVWDIYKLAKAHALKDKEAEEAKQP